MENVSPDYRIVNYELDGREIRNYNALREGVVSNNVWTVIEEFYDSVNDNEYLPYSVITRVLLTDTYNETLSQDTNGQLSFEGNKLTITMENDAKDEIFLLFVDGFWEVVEE